VSPFSSSGRHWLELLFSGRSRSASISLIRYTRRATPIDIRFSSILANSERGILEFSGSSGSAFVEGLPRFLMFIHVPSVYGSAGICLRLPAGLFRTQDIQ